jgi:hypothetical protein
MAAGRLSPSVVGMTTDRHIKTRLAMPGDAGALERLAELDSAAPLTGRVLLAEAGGAPVAAVSLETGAVNADPFQHTADAVRVLMWRRYQIMGQGSDVAPARSLLRRLVPGPAR